MINPTKARVLKIEFQISLNKAVLHKSSIEFCTFNNNSQDLKR